MISGVVFWWGYLDLNQGPTGYEPAALTTELYPHIRKYTDTDRF